MYCPKCGNTIEKGEETCSICGQQLQTIWFFRNSASEQARRRRVLVIFIIIISITVICGSVFIFLKNRGSDRIAEKTQIFEDESDSDGNEIIVDPKTPTMIYNEAKKYFDNEDYDEAIPLLQEAADLGEPNAQAYLGICYLNGLGSFEENGVGQNYIYGVKWLKLAANSGQADAQANLAYCYDIGSGVEQDTKQAVYWYTLAAKQGIAQAQFLLAKHYETGDGVEQDFQEAVKWLQLSAEQGIAIAQYWLGYNYEHGIGIERDLEKAEEMYNAAATSQWFIAPDYDIGDLIND